MNVETVNNSRDLAQMMTSLNLDIEARRKFIEAAGKADDFVSFVKDVNSVVILRSNNTNISCVPGTYLFN